MCVAGKGGVGTTGVRASIRNVFFLCQHNTEHGVSCVHMCMSFAASME